MRSTLLDEGADAFGRVARHHVRNHDLRGVPVSVGKAHSVWIPSRCDPIGMVAEERRQLIRAIDRRKIRDGLGSRWSGTRRRKSSLMRALTGSEVLVADKLFATLDTRCALQPEMKPRVLVSDRQGLDRLPEGSPRLANLIGL